MLPFAAHPPGTLLAGKYRVERLLGAGAMGIVLAARHIDLDELRAVKLMLPSMLGDAEGVERFLREARAAVRLKSAHVARVLDVGRLDDGTPFIVLEYLEGADLKHILEARGTLPVAETVTYLLQACDALAEAHAMGIVHRDIKPANLFVTTGPTGAPWIKVLDFGIAKVEPRAGAPGAVEVTRTSEIIGTPVFMSPEQMRSTRDVDPRTDVWSLGVVLYRALTGLLPFAGASVTQVCAAVMTDHPPAPSVLRAGLPPGLDELVLRCLEKNPEHRFANAAELARAIAPFAHGAPVTIAVAPPAPAIAPEAARDSGQMLTLPRLPAPAGGQTTSRASSWIAGEAAPRAAPRSRAALIAGALALVGVIASVAVLLRAGTAHPPPAASTSATVSGAGSAAVTIAEPAPTHSAPPMAPREPFTPTNASSALASPVAPAASAELMPPAPSSSATIQRPVTPPAPPSKSASPPRAQPTKKDAFGEERE